MSKEILAKDVVERLMAVYGVKDQTALAGEIGSKQSTISNWLQRNTIPYEVCVLTAQAKGVSLDYLILGKDGEDRPPMISDGTKGNKRFARMVGFLRDWFQHRSADEAVWLEQHLVRTVPEYAEWLVKHTG